MCIDWIVERSLTICSDFRADHTLSHPLVASSRVWVVWCIVSIYMFPHTMRSGAVCQYLEINIINFIIVSLCRNVLSLRRDIMSWLTASPPSCLWFDTSIWIYHWRSMNLSRFQYAYNVYNTYIFIYLLKHVSYTVQRQYTMRNLPVAITIYICRFCHCTWRIAARVGVLSICSWM